MVMADCEGTGETHDQPLSVEKIRLVSPQSDELATIGAEFEIPEVQGGAGSVVELEPRLYGALDERRDFGDDELPSGWWWGRCGL
jgi:hypothetical protein